MSKSLLTKLLVLVALVACLVCAFSIAAFAEDAASTEATTGDLTLQTRYGEFVVPAESANKAWVAFNSNKTFIMASDIFGADSGSILDHSKHSRPEETHYIFLLRDHSNANAQNVTFHNGALIQSNIIVDLMGHTFTSSATGCDAAVRLQIKNSVDHNLRLTFENGTIASESSLPLFAVIPGEGTPNVNVTFNGVTFTTTGKAASWISAVGNGAGYKFKTNFNFNDCVFDLTNTTTNVAMFSVGNQHGYSTDTINIKGGTVIGNTSNVTWYSNSSLDFFKGFHLLPDENGEYLVNKRLTADAAASKVFMLEDSSLAQYTKAGASEGDYTYYSLEAATGELIEKYNNIDEYPFAIFDLRTGELLTFTPYLNGETAEHAFYNVSSRNKGNFAILMRRNYVAENTTNSKIASTNAMNLYFDLGGHTLTLGNTLYLAYSNGTANVTANYKTVNGTIVTGSHKVVDFGIYWKTKTLNFYFEDVTFDQISGTIVSDTKGHDTDSRYYTTAPLTFTDCTFNVAGMNDYLFNLGKVAKSVFIINNIKIYGGTLNAYGSFKGLFTSNGRSSKSFCLYANDDGEFPIITTPLTDATTYGGTLPASFGEGYYVKVSDDADKNVSVFKLAAKTAYGDIPVEYANEQKYPFAIFDTKNNTFLTATSYLNGNNEAYAFYVTSKYDPGEYVIVVRRNYTTSGATICEALLNHTKVGKNQTHKLTVDLNGYTLTLGNNLYYGYPRSGAPADAIAYVITKNGTINCGKHPVLRMGAYYLRKSVYFNFENVTFNNIQDNLIIDNASVSANSGNQTQYYPSFTDCTFNQNASSSASLFNLGQNTDYINVIAKIYGGTINASGNSYIYSIKAGKTSKAVYFGANAEGKYTTVNVADVTKIAESTYTTPDRAPLGVRKTAENTYVLTPFAITNAFLNITNDLNLVYRVYLPAGYANPTATFAVDEHTFTVNEYTLDENGLYCFMLSAIGPHRMADTVTATVSATYNDAIVTVTNNTLSVKSYADMVRAQNAENAELIALLDALLVYGANAQVYMGHNTDSLVAELGELAEIPEGTIEKNGTTNTDYSIVSAGLRLGGAFDFGVQIKAADLTGLTLKITKGGVEKTVTLTEDMKVGEYYVVYYNGLIASELDESVTFTLVQNGEQIGKSLTLTANAYLAALQTSENTALASLTKALYAYGVAANIYEEVGEDPNYVPKAEIVNKGGAEGTVSYVIDDDDKATATFANSLLAKYSNLTLTYAVRTKSIATLLTEEGPDGLLHYRQANDGSYLYTLNEANVAFWREITASDRVELVNHTHTHAYWGANDDGGEFEYLKTSGDTVYTSTQPVGSSSKELYAAWQILKDVFGDLDPKNTLTFIDAGIGVLTGDKEIDGKTIVGYKKYFNQLLSDAMEADKLITVRSTFTTTTPEGSTSKVVTNDNLVTDAQRMKVPAYMILNANAGDNIENWTAYIDHALAKNGWAPFCIHLIRESEVNTHHILQSQADQLFAYTAELGDRVWVATYTDASLYFCEWASAEVSCEYADGAVTVTLTDEENNEVFDMPLTVKVSVPRSFRSGAVANGKFLTVHKNEDGTQYVLVDVVPDSGAVTIRAK